jgi:hypothetical protein
MIELPRMFGGRALKTDDNVTPLRDAEPTRPMRYVPGGYTPYTGQPPVYHVQTRHQYEMEKAKTIFLAVVDEPTDSRDRIRRQVDLLLEMYSPDKPHPEGSPV